MARAIRYSASSRWLCLLSLISSYLAVCAYGGLYSPQSHVKVVSGDQFQSQVVDTAKVSLVEFYADWCGHCRNLVPEYESAAMALNGVIDVFAVDDQSVMQRYGVQGFPTLKVFVSRGNGKAPKIFDYNGERTARAITSFVSEIISKVINVRLNNKGKASNSGQENERKPPSKKKEAKAEDSAVVVLNSSNFDSLVMENTSDTWFVEFYAPWCGHCKALEPIWEEAAQAFKGKVLFGKVDATSEEALATRFNINAFPKLKLFPAGKKADHSVVEYEGDRNLAAFEAFLQRDHSQSIEQILTGEQFNDSCESSLCLVAFLPHILDSMASGRNQYLQDLLDIRKKADTPLKYFWTQGQIFDENLFFDEIKMCEKISQKNQKLVYKCENLLLKICVLQHIDVFSPSDVGAMLQGGDHPDLESQLHLGFGFPALLAVSLKNKLFVVHRGSFTKDSIHDFIKNLGTGRLPVQNLPEKLGFAEASAWDGQDGSPEVEDDEPSVPLADTRNSEL